MSLVELEPIEPDSLAHRIVIRDFPNTPNSFADILEECIEGCEVGSRNALREFFQTLRDHNIRELNQFDEGLPIAITLDGRKEVNENGFLGDAVEASRTIHAIRAVRQVRVVTPHHDVFTQVAPNVGIVPIDPGIGMKWYWPCNCGVKSGQYHTAIKNAAVPAEVIGAPIICKFPYWYGRHVARPQLPDVALPPRYMAIKQHYLRMNQKHFWTDGRVVNQVHAHQLWLYILGVLNEPQVIPPPFLVQGPIVDNMALIMNRELNRDSRLLLIHIGTDGEAVKKWPLESWRSLIDRVAQELPDFRVCFLWPTNPIQRNETQGLLDHAHEHHLEPLSFDQDFSLPELVMALRNVINYFHNPPIMVGLDSLPAGHLYPALGGKAVVIGNKQRKDFHFSCPASNISILVLPPGRLIAARYIPPEEVLSGILYLE